MKSMRLERCGLDKHSMAFKSTHYFQDSCMRVAEDADGIFQCYGKLENSELSNDAKKPILLPRNHCLTLLITEAFHRGTLHGEKDKR